MKQYKNKLIKSIFGAAICFSALILTTSCADQLEREFYNPDEVTEARLDFFFTDALRQGNLFRPDYGGAYHQINNFARQFGLGTSVAQSFARRSSLAPVQFWTTWSGEAFQPIIFNSTGVSHTVNLNAIQLLYNDMDTDDQEVYRIFMLCSRIVRAFAFQRSTDLYGSIPYFEAGGAFQQKFYAKYDTQEAIYDHMLADLAEVSAELKDIIDNNKLSARSNLLFRASDVLNEGDLEKWLRFCNSLRLRMAMRLTNVKPNVAQQTATALIAENRLATETRYDITFAERNQNPTEIILHLFFRGFEELATMLQAPQFVLEDILKADQAVVDPRKFVLFQPNREGDYVGFSYLMDDMSYYRKFWPESRFNAAALEARIDSIAWFRDMDGQDGAGWTTNRLASQWNRVTFLNYEIRFPVLMSTEVNLMVAEADLRWGVGADQGSRIRQAIDASTRYWYHLNMSNRFNENTIPAVRFIQKGAKVNDLDEAHLAAFLDAAVADYNSLPTFADKLRFLFHQKYIHYNFLNPFETFADARRIIKDLDGEIPVKIMANYFWWERLLYPSSEATTNRENFQAVADQNYVNKTLWWTGRTNAAINPNASPGVNLVLP
jgi:hypothetical protein